MMTERTHTPYTFLLVEDDVFLSDMYCLKFNAEGHTLQVAPRGEVALDVLRGGYTPDAIIFDLVMPNMDGFELMERINTEGLKGRSIFIVLSNQGEKEDIEHAQALGAVGHIVKANAIPSEVVTAVETFVAENKKKAPGNV